MKFQTKLTSVNVLDDVYKKFRLKTVENPINLQKLVNRCLDLYTKDESFRNKIDNYDGLTSSGSKF
jgi:hypothetical protein